MPGHSSASIARRLAEADPRSTTALDYATPFQLLVATVLSALTTDVARRILLPIALRDPSAASDAAADGRLGHLLYRQATARRLSITMIGFCGGMSWRLCPTAIQNPFRIKDPLPHPFEDLDRPTPLFPFLQDLP